MIGELRIYYQDKFGSWHLGLGGFEEEQTAIEAAKDLSEQMRAKIRVVEALTGRVRSVVEVVLA
jgi:hypothetical protein